ncbi:hypothetical protein [Pragia fontium]|uniref:hypothetical protein n=1 Tax=Pragia fontium TaxID=82985 RepID=UPI00064A1F97|nr:hypothetical protein [Pragia fontium]AKJ40691.1 hypothetical protein QQ39_00235 [Pragia fontium]
MTQNSLIKTLSNNKMMILLISVAIIIAIYILTPSSTPSCYSPSVNKTMSNMFLRANIEKSISARERYLGKMTPTFSTLKKQTQVSYNKETRTRYCTATAVFSIYSDTRERTTKEQEIGYIISPTHDDNFKIQTQDKDYIVNKYANQKKPLIAGEKNSVISEQQINDLFIARVKKLDSGTSNNRASNKIRTMSESINWITLTDNCQKQTDERYICPLLVGFYDNLLETLGRGSNLKLHIALPLVKENDVWKTTDEFNDIFMKSIVKARLINVYGEDAVKKME